MKELPQPPTISNVQMHDYQVNTLSILDCLFTLSTLAFWHELGS